VGVRLLDAPTARADDPRARVYIVDQVKPGARFTRHVEVANGDPEPMDVLVYPAAAHIADGDFSIDDRSAPGPIPQWVTVSPTHLHLAPGERAPVTVDVAVPSDAPAGEVYGGIVAERPAAATGQGVRVNLRAAIRVYLSVGPGGEPASDFVINSLTAARDRTGRPYVLAQVHNTGGRALDLSGTLRLTDGPGGLSAGPFDARLGTTLGIGQTEPVTVVLDKALPPGPWLATLDLRSGLLRRRAKATITFPVQVGSQAAPVKATAVPLYKDRGVVSTVAAFLILLVLAALLVLWLIAWRRRREEREERPVGSRT
ncbi:MAG: hypothetical protein WCD35_11000, partial [Mycobacteriales bacterium]